MMIIPLINHLWQSTLFALAVVALTFLLRQHSARIRHAIWLTASIKFLLPFSLFVSLGDQFEAGRRVIVPAVKIAPSAVATAIEPFAPVTSLPIPDTAEGNRTMRLIPVIWLGGTALVLASWLMRWYRMYRIRLQATPLAGIAAPIPVLETRSLLEPGVFGILRPALLLPAGITVRLSAEQRDAILAHELAHVRRRDNLTSALQMAVEALFWFHPLVWWIGARLVVERENACDEEVLRSGSQPQVYAEGIVNVCKFYLESPLPCAAGVTSADLKKRITAILTNPTRSPLGRSARAALAAVAVAAVVIPLAVGLAQDLPSNHKFEVASIRPNTTGQRNTSIHTGQARFTTSGTSLVSLITFAYGIQGYQLTGGPNWVRDDRWDIAAKFEEAEEANLKPSDLDRQAARNHRMQSRVRNLLAERFQLQLREEVRELPIYALTIDRAGLKLKPSPEGSGNMNVNQNNGMGTLTGSGRTLEGLSRTLSGILGRPVVDETGTKELFDMEMKWASDQAAEAGSGPTIFTALREQMGLKLESKRGPVKAFVIEKVEKPSEN